VDTIAWLATDRSVRPDGRLYLDRRPRPYDRFPSTRLDREQRRLLWDAVVAMAGVPDPTFQARDSA